MEGLGCGVDGLNPKGEKPITAMQSSEQKMETFVQSVRKFCKWVEESPSSPEGEIKLALDSKNGMFNLVMNSSGQEMNGTWIQGGQSTPAVFKRADYAAEQARQNEKDFLFTSSADLQGHWKGAWGSAIKAGAKEINLSIPMELEIAKMPDGTYSVAIANLEQLGNNYPIPASNFECSPPELHAEWKWAGGAYDGRLEKGKIAGTWSQGGGKFTLVFEREK